MWLTNMKYMLFLAAIFYSALFIAQITEFNWKLFFKHSFFTDFNLSKKDYVADSSQLNFSLHIVQNKGTPARLLHKILCLHSGLLKF